MVTKSPGAANVIPDAMTARYMVRSRTAAGLAALRPRIEKCFEAGALATGCTVEYEELSPVYSHMEPDAGLLGAYRTNAEALGRTFDADDSGTPPPTLSTDMANVSLARAHDPSAHRDRGGRLDQPPARVRRRLRDRFGRRGRARRRRRAGLDAIDAAADPELRARLLASGR